ncbi:Ger(x)C family spore germination C-terminal domain-containing protein [Paenibacillus sp. P26]|nr:Ger(x)C family spore germination C-terminal domain-containing protein [Paenibacillus sp. P26]
MGFQRPEIRGKLRMMWLVPLFCAVLTGCEMEGSRMRPLASGGETIFAAGVDEGPGGLRVSSLHRPVAGGQLKAEALGELRTRMYTSFSDAAWTWQQSETPRLLLIGEEWVKRHGFPASWARQLYRAGLSGGRWPQVAVVQGTAEQFLTRAGAAEQGMRMLELGGGGDPFRGGSLAYEEDLALPYLAAGDANHTILSGAVLFKKQRLSGYLSSRESELLACLQGRGTSQRLTMPDADEVRDDILPVLTRAVCRTTVSGNGDLRHPVLKVRLSVEDPERRSVPGADRAVWEQNLTRGASRWFAVCRSWVPTRCIGGTPSVRYTRGYGHRIAGEKLLPARIFV